MRTWMGGRAAAVLAVLAVLAAAMAAAPLQAQQRTRAVIVGQVVDAESKAPLAGVLVRVPGAHTEAATEADGTFHLRLRSGSHGVTLTRLGYHGLVQTWEVAGDSGDVGVVELRRDAVVLEALEVTADRLERERLMVPVSSRSFGVEELARSASFNAADFVRMRAGGVMVTCSSGADRDCVARRGSVYPVCVVIDDAPAFGGMAELSMYQARDFARMHVYSGGTFVQVYTPEYLDRLARTKRRPMSTSIQMMSYCRGRLI